MYNAFFGFREAPFSIAPDPRYLYLSERHKEALAHLMYGVQGQGGFIVITGEVGTGKTTICRCFLDSAPRHADVALILNPRLSARELLASICDELEVSYPAGASNKRLIDQLNRHLLDAHARGRHTVLIIDEAQNLEPPVLEQLRLLTNLETREKKLLQIVLLGQPELRELLARQSLRQLSQRVTARYHLESLGRDELEAYVRYRLSVAGVRQQPFTPAALRALYRLSRGTPRLINLIADRALLGAYTLESHQVSKPMVRQAAREVFGKPVRQSGAIDWRSWLPGAALASATGAFVAVLFWLQAGSPAAPGESSVAVAAEGSPKADLSAETPAEPTPPRVSEKTPSRAEDPTPPRELARFIPAPDNKAQAYVRLFSAWGLEFDPTGHRYACDYAETRGLRCLHREGNWRSLLDLNRPAVLQLHNHQGSPVFAALTGVEEDRLELYVEGQRFHATREQVDSLWLGDYSLLWQLPPYESPLIRPGDITDRKLWLGQALDRLWQHYGAGGAREKPPGETLEDRVRWYQRQVGLVPDGVVGARTLIHMNSDLEPTVPRLTPDTGGAVARLEEPFFSVPAEPSNKSLR